MALFTNTVHMAFKLWGQRSTWQSSQVWLAYLGQKQLSYAIHVALNIEYGKEL